MGQKVSFALCLAGIPMALTALYAMHVYADLPEHVAMHWDWEGSPSLWVSRMVFVSSFILFVSLLNVILVTAFWIPPGLVRFPHKRGWLSLSGMQHELRARLRMGLSGGLVLLNWAALGGFHLTVSQAIPLKVSSLNFSPGQYTLGVLVATGIFLGWFYMLMRPPAQRAPS